MKIYLAARYSRLPEMQTYRDQLEGAGHKVTSRWVNGDHQVKDTTMSPAEACRFAQEDWEDLLVADMVISFTEPSRSGHSRGGRHVEHGIALALRKRVVVVGHRENVFHCLPEVAFY